jgi:hypothetical protein
MSASVPEYSLPLQKPNVLKSFWELLITVDPIPGRKVLADLTTEVRSIASRVAEQAKTDIETKLGSAVFYTRFGTVLDYIDTIIQVTGQIASVCGLHPYVFTIII